MKILHTADWHLGQTFYEYDRRTEHHHFLEWLKRQIKQRDIDLLLLAGDVFDGPNPSAESQRMYYHFLRQVTTDNPLLQIIIIAGNHDSAARLEAPNPLFDGMNITVRGVVKRDSEGEIDLAHLIIPVYKKESLPLIRRAKESGKTEEELLPITMNRDHIAAFCLAVPYLRQGDYPPSENYSKGIQALYNELFNEIKEEGKPVIAMGHLQATGAELSENDRSERTVIGGLEGVAPDAFDRGIVYTALGHLHRVQRVSERENVRYAGAPIPMTFAEKKNRNSIVLIEIDERKTGIDGRKTTLDEGKTVIDKRTVAIDERTTRIDERAVGMSEGRVNITRLEVPLYVPLQSIPPLPEPLEGVMDAIFDLPDGESTERSPYLEVKIKMTEPDTSYKYKIESALQGKAVRLARIVAVMPTLKSTGISAASYEELQSLYPVDVALDYYKRRYGEQEMPAAMKQLLEEVVKEVEL